MNYPTVARSDFAASKPRRSTRKATPYNFFGGASVACLVLGCAWTVYANVFAAGIYPVMSAGDFDGAVVKSPQTLVARRAPPAVRNVVAALSEPPPLIAAPATRPKAPSLSFDDRFAAAARQGQAPRQLEAPTPQAETTGLAEVPKPLEFADRFAAAAPQGVDPQPQAETARLAEAPRPLEAMRLAEAAKPKETSPTPAPVQLAAIAPVQRPTEARPAKSSAATVHDMAQRAKAAVISLAAAEKPSIVEKLWGKPQARASLLAYASADASVTGSLGPGPNPALGGAEPLYDRSTAVYDISAHMVYLPDGTRLEAHSGLGDKLDDPKHVSVRMRGATPPHVYDLTPREALFHGVAALRLNPVGGEDAIFGRTGLLAHTYMLGPNGDSNGCVSFKDYNAFLNAYRNQGIKRLAVVSRVE
jgi:hypothetical protein